MKKLVVAAAALCVASAGAWAQTEIAGLTFSTWTDNDYYRGAGIPLDGYVAVGPSALGGQWYQYGGQYTSARSEFNLAGQQAANAVMLSFQFDGRSTVMGAAQTPSMPVILSWYSGDNVANVSDWRDVTFPPGSLFWIRAHEKFGEFDAASFASGQTLSFDVTSLYNSAIARGDAALGIGLDFYQFSFQYARFSDFTLTVPAVPEPSTYALTLVGLVAVAMLRRRHDALRGETVGN